MKHLKFILLLLSISILSLVSCEKEENQKPNQNETPTISLESKGSTTTSITFDIVAANGENCAYMILAGSQIPSAEDILNNGVTVSATETSTHTISDLQQDTYYSVIAAIYGNEQFATSDIISIKTQKEDTPENPSEAPTIEIEPVFATNSKITFTITTTNAEKCAYVLFNGSAPDAQSIISSGIEVTTNTSAPVTIENLQSNTTYTVIAAAFGNEQYVTSEILSMQTEEDTPIDEDAIVFEETIDGRWYSGNNYYVGLRGIGGQVLYLDIYSSTSATQNGTILPLGNYYLDESGNGSLGYNDCTFLDSGSSTTVKFKSANLNVSTSGTKYRFDIEWVVEGTEERFTGYYVGKLPNVKDPEGGSGTETELIRINNITSNAINFTITSDADRDWRCVVIEKVTYDMYPATPEDFLNTFGFYGNGPTTYNWENGSEPIVGMPVTITPGMDYIIMAGYYSYASNSIVGDVSSIIVRTKDAEDSKESITVEILNIESTKIQYKCTPSSGVFKYRTCVITKELVNQAEAEYSTYGYSSFEAFMQYLIESSASQSELHYEEATTTWSGLYSHTDYCICNLLYDTNNATKIEITDFTTL